MWMGGGLQERTERLMGLPGGEERFEIVWERNGIIPMITPEGKKIWG